jgi:hypothetical protein
MLSKCNIKKLRHNFSEKVSGDIYRRTLINIIPSFVLFKHSLKAQTSITDQTTVTDHVLAYKFSYPRTSTKGEPINLTFSRRPEKYSSAAPMSANARQRIVCELIDITAALTLSVSVCAPDENKKGEYIYDRKPSEVVEEVLKDRNMTAQGKTLQSNIESIEVNDIDGQTYWYYEYTSQASPNIIKSDSKKNFRHTLSVSVVRMGLNDNKPYIYTLNVTSSEILWSEVAEFAKNTVNSFVLLRPTNEFITPEKNPWMFF